MTTHPPSASLGKVSNPAVQPRLKRLALYAFYDSRGIVSEYIIYKLQKLRDHVDTLVVVCNGAVDAAGKALLEDVADTVHLRENAGFDIWAYRTGLIEVVGWEKLNEFDEVLLLNSTFYGPLYPFSELFNEMDQRTDDFWGITAFKGPVPNAFTWVGIIPTHIQSYFMAFRRRLFTTRAFRDYWENLPDLLTYEDAVLKHETLFTEFLSKQGFRYSLYCDPEKYAAPNPAFDLLDLLVEDRCPVLKRRAFFHEPMYLDLNNVDLARALSLIRTKTDYDPGLIWKDVTRLAKPHDLYTNATLLEVPPELGEAPALRADIRVAVLAHVEAEELLPELLSFVGNIPCPFDLYVTTVGVESKKHIERLLASEKRAKLWDVRLVGAEAHTASSLLSRHRDVVLSGKYDYLCRVHTNAASGDSFTKSRHFRAHHFENLLWNRTYVAHLLSSFERDPSLGIILAPAIHIAHLPPGSVDLSVATAWARKLGIVVPLDSRGVEVSSASMFWCRPAALRILFERELRAADFAIGHDGTGWPLERVLEWLVVPAVHQTGYHAMSVLTPSNLAKSYVKLEYKLQKMIGTPRPPAPGPVFPKGEMKDFFRRQIAASPTAFSAARALFRASRAGVRLALGVVDSRKGKKDR